MSLTPPSIAIYIDDDIDDIQFMQDAFNKYGNGIQLKTFQNAQEGLAYLNSLYAGQIDPCLVILDINMAPINGKDLLVKLRNDNRFQSTPIVLYSTSNSVHEMKFAENYNAGFITKPLVFDQMEVIIDELVGHCSNGMGKQGGGKLRG